LLKQSPVRAASKPPIVAVRELSAKVQIAAINPRDRNQRIPILTGSSIR
jgi:hypothetical protein